MSQIEEKKLWVKEELGKFLKFTFQKVLEFKERSNGFNFSLMGQDERMLNLYLQKFYSKMEEFYGNCASFRGEKVENIHNEIDRICLLTMDCFKKINDNLEDGVNLGVVEMDYTNGDIEIDGYKKNESGYLHLAKEFQEYHNKRNMAIKFMEHWGLVVKDVGIDEFNFDELWEINLKEFCLDCNDECIELNIVE